MQVFVQEVKYWKKVDGVRERKNKRREGSNSTIQV